MSTVANILKFHVMFKILDQTQTQTVYCNETFTRIVENIFESFKIKMQQTYAKHCRFLGNYKTSKEIYLCYPMLTYFNYVQLKLELCTCLNKKKKKIKK